MKKISSIIIILLVILFLYGRYIEPSNLKINEYSIKTDKIAKSFYDLKIIQFSDVLYDKDSNKLNKIKDEINNLSPDIIIFSGDLFNKKLVYNDDDFNNLKMFLKSLDAELYKYAVIGDNDEKFLAKYKDILYESNFKLLDNQNDLLFYKDITPINIIGVSNTNDIDSLLQSDIPYSYVLAITHKPDNIDILSNYNIDIVLSSHSLGGIINIPYYGGVIKKDGAETYINDYYKVNNTLLFISNGLGYEKYNFRLFNTPSINIYRFAEST